MELPFYITRSGTSTIPPLNRMLSVRMLDVTHNCVLKNLLASNLSHLNLVFFEYFSTLSYFLAICHKLLWVIKMMTISL